MKLSFRFYVKITLLFLLLPTIQTASAQQKSYVLMLSKGEHKMRVLDYETLDSITSIPVGEDPHEIELSTDNHTAYISNAVIAGTGHIINVIDLQKLQPVKDIDTKPFMVPHGMAFRNDTLWFTAQGSKAVVAYSTTLNKPVQVLGTGQDFTHLLYMVPVKHKLYTSNVESGTLSIYEEKLLPPYMPPTGVLPANAKPRTEWRQTLVDVGYGAEGFDVSPNGKELWVARPDGHIIIVNLEKEKVKADIDTKVLGLHRLKFTPDGKAVTVVSVKTGDLLIFNSQNHKKETQMNIGRGAGIFMDKGNNRMFVACTPDNCVVVLNLTTRKEIKRFSISRPDGLTAAFVE